MSEHQKPNRLQVWSAPALLFIHRLPKFAFPLFTAALLLGGLWVAQDFVGGGLLLCLGLLLMWLVALSWQLLAWPARITRVVLLVLVFGYAAGRFAGKL